jgi:hypothetical protein
MILDQLPVTRLVLTFEVLEDRACPAHKGEMLHEGLAYWLAVCWCHYRQGGKPPAGLRCERCDRRVGCLYGGELIQPLVRDTWSDWARKSGPTPPPAYALWDMQDRRTRLFAGDPLSYEVTLIGAQAIAQVEEFIKAADIAARRGLGQQERLRAQLMQVTALVAPDDGSPEEVDYREVADASALALCYGQAARQADREARPLRCLSLRFLSPLAYTEENWETGADEPITRPDLAPLMRSLLRRLRLLSEVHGGGEWPRDESHALERLADGVSLDYHETQVAAYARKPRGRGTDTVHGLVGQAWYSSDDDLRPLLPALWLGQWLHLGKGAAYGNGRYAIEQVG